MRQMRRIPSNTRNDRNQLVRFIVDFDKNNNKMIKTTNIVYSFRHGWQLNISCKGIVEHGQLTPYSRNLLTV